MSTEPDDDTLITNPIAIFALMVVAGVIDTIVVPVVLSLPAIAVLTYVPVPWSIVGFLLFIIPLGYMLAFLFTRPTDPAWPIGPAERLLFRTP